MIFILNGDFNLLYKVLLFNTFRTTNLSTIRLLINSVINCEKFISIHTEDRYVVLNFASSITVEYRQIRNLIILKRISLENRLNHHRLQCLYKYKIEKEFYLWNLIIDPFECVFLILIKNFALFKGVF